VYGDDKRSLALFTRMLTSWHISAAAATSCALVISSFSGWRRGSVVSVR
jgi:hypothetical protein